MARRRTPPLFEFMTRPGGSAGSEGTRPREGAGGAYPRLRPDRGDDAPPSSPSSPSPPTRTAAPLSARGVAGGDAYAARRAPFIPRAAAMWAGMVVVALVVWLIAYRLGREAERRDLLPSQPPPAGALGDSAPPLVSEREERRATTPPPAPVDGGSPANAGALAVFGDDPRRAGYNYLIVERLPFVDAERAARFLTQNGVPSAVVAPEGQDPARLAQNSRATWLLIAREGVASSDFRASKPRRDALVLRVQQIGRRWKQDHRGTSEFASSVWDKFGK